jgi:beta-galactosidase
MDGLCFSNHTPTPGLTEYAKAIEPVQVLDGSTHEKVLIINRYDFITLDHLQCKWSIVGDGFKGERKEVSVPKGIKPGTTAAIFISEAAPEDISGESYLEVSFSLKKPTSWAEAGHEVAWGQVPIKLPHRVVAPLRGSRPLQVTKISPSTLEVVGMKRRWRFDMVHGFLESWVGESNQETFHQQLNMDFYRAVTDNERNNDGWEWRNQRLHQTTPHLQSFETSINNESNTVTVIAKHRIAPPVLQWSVETTTTYTIHDNSISIHVHGNPWGLRLPRTFARIGLTLTFKSNITSCNWFGRGPGESYSDSKQAQRFGNWSMPINDLYTPYEYPQESGNRTDVRWVEFGGEAGKIRASFGDQEGCSFSASHYTTRDLDECTHPFELEKRRKDEVIVRLDWAHQGLGTGSCGPKVLPAYELLSKPFEFDLHLE